ncbi:hypothetical protein [Rothia sp. ZJ932]|uniref:hypothetical protein n=1 Tax=Rothia sp. ZJ932 TaxID=2810516 RepID=UPI0019676B88|nr:hypothetical protein [Rothia sp. ZJ932]QRZ62672.1 hypothetical protein JR346_10310 [Rothia sp. ZJ932]
MSDFNNIFYVDHPHDYIFKSVKRAQDYQPNPNYNKETNPDAPKGQFVDAVDKDGTPKWLVQVTHYSTDYDGEEIMEDLEIQMFTHEAPTAPRSSQVYFQGLRLFIYSKFDRSKGEKGKSVGACSWRAQKMLTKDPSATPPPSTKS